MLAFLPNIAWHTLSGPHRIYATGTDTARRYARGFSPIVGFADPAHPDFAALAPFFEPGEHFYTEGWSGRAPRGWEIDEDDRLVKMLWDAPPPDESAESDIVLLGPGHIAAALALTDLTKPGPFGPRTPTLGEYYGVFDGGNLVAMAGERMHAGNLREVSGVCTHPDHQGRGLARRLVRKLVQRQLQRGELPFLHVMCDNGSARRLYRQLGFRDARESVVRRVVRR